MSAECARPLAFVEHTFVDASALADALASGVAAQLRSAIDARGLALLAVSGGTTPRLFLHRLAREALDWSRVVVTLCDERWVPPSNARSNARLVTQTLLQGAAAAARFVPLFADSPDPESALAGIEARVAALPLPLDAAVLGMGSDGHTASFFPGGDRLEEALDPESTAHVLPIRASAAGEPRITLTLPVIAGARSLWLHIEGRQKQAVFAAIARGEGEWTRSPLRRVMENCRAPIGVYWCN